MPYFFGTIQIVSAVLLAALIVVGVPMQGLLAPAMVWLLISSMAIAGVSLLIRSPLSYRICVAANAATLALEVALLVLLTGSAFYLAGVYGAFGRGAALLVGLVALFSIYYFALFAICSLRFARSGQGHSHFRLAEL